MRGHIFSRSEGSWTIVLDVGRKLDQKTGRMKRLQKWETIRGTRREAEAILADKLQNMRVGICVMPSRMFYSDWLDEWFERFVKEFVAVRTISTYEYIIRLHLKPILGGYRLKELADRHIQNYLLVKQEIAPATISQHLTVIHKSLSDAVRDKKLCVNPSHGLAKPQFMKTISQVIQDQYWDEHEMRKFLDVCKRDGSRSAAFYQVALDSGARKAELGGLKWEHVDFKERTLMIAGQLDKASKDGPTFSLPKNGYGRKVAILQETVELLKTWRQEQDSKRNLLGSSWADHGLVFTREFGQPLSLSNIGQREFARLIKLAGVKPITFHGLRHTCATLMIAAGIHMKIISDHLGHSNIETTMDIYGHVSPMMKIRASDERRKFFESESGHE